MLIEGWAGIVASNAANQPASCIIQVTANITPDLDTGIGKWSPEFFQKKIYEYKDYAEHGSPPMAGPQSFTLMPWLAFSGLTREDLGAMYAFLRSVKPVRHLVETHPSFPGS